MSEYIRRLVAPLALSMAMIVGGCNAGRDDAGDTTLAQDSALDRDLALANRDSAAQPQLSDVPASPNTKTTPAARTPGQPSGTAARPSGTTARPSKTPSGNTREAGTGTEARIATIGTGTTISLVSDSRVCTNTHKAGDRFTAKVAQTVTGQNGATIPAGATAVVRVTSVSGSGNANEPVRMGFLVDQIRIGERTYPIDATITDVKVEQVRTSTRGDDAKKVVGGAVAGAVLGQILGKDTRSTVIGAATGAAAGTAVAMATGDFAGCLPAGGTIAIRLNSPATIQVTE